MALAADRRAREDLDLFLLALISQGVNTPYRMQSLAGISQGTSLQAIKRLLRHRLIRAGEEGSRRSKTWSLTRAGRTGFSAATTVLPRKLPSATISRVCSELL